MTWTNTPIGWIQEEGSVANGFGPNPTEVVA